MIRFTKEEKTVLLFLVACLFMGTGVLYYKRLHPCPYAPIEFNEKEIRRSEVNKVKKININKATRLELMRIKNIGPVLAGRIIAYREEYGRFGRPEDIKNVKGIGDKTYERIKDEILLE